MIKKLKSFLRGDIVIPQTTVFTTVFVKGKYFGHSPREVTLLVSKRYNPYHVIDACINDANSFRKISPRRSTVVQQTEWRVAIPIMHDGHLAFVLNMDYDFTEEVQKVVRALYDYYGSCSLDEKKRGSEEAHLFDEFILKLAGTMFQKRYGWVPYQLLSGLSVPDNLRFWLNWI